MEMTVKEVLIAARAKIADPANWTQGECAREIRGRRVNSNHRDAVCWCSLGAIGASVKGGDLEGAFVELEAVMDQDIARFNDTHTHAEVLAKFDEAIAAQGGE